MGASGPSRRAASAAILADAALLALPLQAQAQTVVTLVNSYESDGGPKLYCARQSLGGCSGIHHRFKHRWLHAYKH